MRYEIIMKKLFITIILLLVVLLCSGCNPTPKETDTDPVDGAITLSQEEKDILEIMKDDINVVKNDDYVTVISSIIAHTHDYIGQVYQVEGKYSLQDVYSEKTPYLSRNVTVEGEERILGLPLRYLDKEIAENTSIRVTAIVNQEDHEGHAHAVLEVIAIESVQ